MNRAFDSMVQYTYESDTLFEPQAFIISTRRQLLSRLGHPKSCPKS